MSSNSKKGKKFEQLTHDMIKLVKPESEIYRNVEIKGKLSKVSREVDIQIIDPKDYDFIAIECKNHDRTIDVPIVEQFHTKLQDIGTKRGAIAANSKFSKASINMAEALNIDLLSPVDTSNPESRIRLSCKSLLEDSWIKNFSLSIASESVAFGHNPMPYEPHKLCCLIDGKQTRLIDIFKELWNKDSDLLITKSGKHECSLPNSAIWPIADINGQSNGFADDIRFIYEVAKNYYRGNVKITDTKGIIDIRTGIYNTKHIVTESLDPLELTKQWEPLAEEDALKLCDGQISMRLTVISQFNFKN